MCSILAMASTNNCSRFSELLYFNESQRYLCMNRTKNIYTDYLNNNTDCIFQHELLSNQYDTYYSHTHPRKPERCYGRPKRRQVNQRSTTQIITSRDSEKLMNQSRLDICHTRWYLGVGASSNVRTFGTKTNRTKIDIYFIQKWFHDVHQHSIGAISSGNRGIVGRSQSSSWDYRSSVSSQSQNSQDKNSDSYNISSTIETDSDQSTLVSSTDSSDHEKLATSSLLRKPRSYFMNKKKKRKSNCKNLLKTNNCQSLNDSTKSASASSS